LDLHQTQKQSPSRERVAVVSVEQIGRNKPKSHEVSSYVPYYSGLFSKSQQEKQKKAKIFNLDKNSHAQYS